MMNSFIIGERNYLTHCQRFLFQKRSPNSHLERTQIGPQYFLLVFSSAIGKNLHSFIVDLQREIGGVTLNVLSKHPLNHHRKMLIWDVQLSAFAIQVPCLSYLCKLLLFLMCKLQCCGIYNQINLLLVSYSRNIYCSGFSFSTGKDTKVGAICNSLKQLSLIQYLYSAVIGVLSMANLQNWTEMLHSAPYPFQVFLPNKK